MRPAAHALLSEALRSSAEHAVPEPPPIRNPQRGRSEPARARFPGRPKSKTPAGPLTSAHAVTKLPARDLDRAQRFYRDRLGLGPVEERDGGLRCVCETTEFHLFLSSGAASGASTQLGFEVADRDGVVADLRARGLQFESFDIAGFEVHDDIVVVPDNYPSKGSGERGTFFRDSEGNLLAIAQATG